MAVHDVLTLSVTIAAAFDTAYAFTSQPLNFPKWAAGLSESLHETPRGWVAPTPEGDALVKFSPPNAYGVLDHHVWIDGKSEIYIPLRMVRNGDGVEVTLTLFRAPGMDDVAFVKDAEAVRRDLDSLKDLLERDLPSPAPAPPSNAASG